MASQSWTFWLQIPPQYIWTNHKYNNMFFSIYYILEILINEKKISKIPNLHCSPYQPTHDIQEKNFTWSAYAYRFSLSSTTILLWPHITTPISWTIPNLKKIMPLQTIFFQYLNVHHHLHMNPIIIHLDDLLIYTMFIYRGWSKGNIIYKIRAWI
jgi:hypothetical protein